MRILGIDVGSSSIKAVELDSAFGRFEIHDYYEQPVTQGEEPGIALMKLMRALPKLPDRIAVTLPASQSTFRHLKLPTKDRKTIATSAGFELEDDLPFVMEKTVYDTSIVGQSKQGTELHAAATLKTHVVNAIAFWANSGINPDLITTETWAYRNLLSQILPKPEQEQPVILVNIGNSRSTLYVHWKGAPVLSREVEWGGRDLTFSISQKYNLSFPQAEQAKIDHGFVVPMGQNVEVTAEQLEFSENILASLQALLVEIRQIELSCKSLTHLPPSQILVSGGTVLLPGLVRVIEENSKIPSRPLQSLSSIAASGVTYSEHTDAVFLLAAATALAMVRQDRASVINFRKGDYAKEGARREFSADLLRRPLLSAGTIAACMILSLVVRSATYHKQMDEVDLQLERSMKQFFGSISGSAVQNYLRNPTSLKNSINKELTKQRELSKLASPNPHDPLDFLNALSSAIPKSVTTDLMQYQVGAASPAPYSQDAPAQASLTFAVNGAHDADTIGSMLGGRLSGVKKDKTEDFAAADGAKQIKVTWSGKPNF